MKFLWVYMRFCFILAGSICLCGCSFFPEPAENPTRYYDLGLPEKTLVPENISITVLPFTSSSGERYRMIRREKNVLYGDDSNKWQMPPGSLVTKYFTLSFSRNAPVRRKLNTKKVVLSGNVTAFESDKGCAVLGIQYKIRILHRKNEAAATFYGSFLLREKIQGKTPSAFAAAMEKAVKKAAVFILRDIEEK